MFSLLEDKVRIGVRIATVRELAREPCVHLFHPPGVNERERGSLVLSSPVCERERSSHVSPSGTVRELEEFANLSRTVRTEKVREL